MEKVKVTTSTVEISGEIDGTGFPNPINVKIYAYEYHENETVLNEANLVSGPEPVSNTGSEIPFSFTIDRYAPDLLDRLYCIYVLAIHNGSSYAIYGNHHYPDDIDGISQWNYPASPKNTFKGLSCIVDGNDAVSLGIAHGNLNAFIDYTWFKNTLDADTIIFEMEGNEYYFDKSRIEWYDTQLQFFADNDINITLILCIENEVSPPEFSWLDPILKHPDCAVKSESPPTAWYTAPNMATKDGVDYFRALHEFIAQRWMRPDKLYGRMEGITVSNEVNSHWFWCNMGDKTEQQYMHDYERAMRITYYALKKYYKHAKTFISLEHNWNRRHGEWPLKYHKGKDFIDILAQSSRDNGDFDWGVNFHPYPEDLGDPTVWNDGTWTTIDYNTLKISGKNMEVLNSYMEREDTGGYLYHGNKFRSIVLGEHGLNCVDNGVQQYLNEQAAGYCYYYWKMLFSDAFESWCFHRHWDHPDEGDLNLGLCDFVGTKKQPIYNVFRDINDNPESVTAFAKSIIGISNWEQIFTNNTTVTAPNVSQLMDSSGLVTVTTTVDDVSDNTAKVRVDFSLNGGGNFYNGDTYIDESFGVQAGYGTPSLDNDRYFQISNIPTNSGANTLTFRWDSKSALNGSGSLAGVYDTDVVLRVKASDGTFSGIIKKSAVFALDNSGAIPLSTCAVVNAPTAGETSITVDASFIEGNPNLNVYYAAVNGGNYGDAVYGDSDTADPGPVEIELNLGRPLNGGDYISKVKCTHIDDLGYAGENENTVPVYAVPYRPLEPTAGNMTTSTVDVIVNRNESEAEGLEYCIQECGKTGQYVQANWSLGGSPVWNTISGWGTVKVTGLSGDIEDYYFRTKSRNSVDDITEGDWSKGVNGFGSRMWTQTTGADFEEGTSSGTYVAGEGEAGEVRLSLWDDSEFSNPGSGDWSYRRKVTISNTGAELSEYQVEVVLTPGTFNYANAKSGGEDIRFSDGTSELYYWIDGWNASDESVMLVKVPTVAATPAETVIYMYYGNTQAGSSSSGAAFDFFDDFSTDTSADYNIVGAGSMSYDGANGLLKQTDTTSDQHWIVSKNAVLPDKYVYSAEVRVITDPQNRKHAGLATDFSTTSETGYRLTHLDAQFPVNKWLLGTGSGIGSIASDNGLSPSNGWLTYTVTRDRSTGLLRLEVTDSATSVNGEWTDSTHVSGSVGLHSYGCEAWWDNIKVRKYSAVEPAAQLGSEEARGAVTGWYVSGTCYSEDIISWDEIIWTEDLSGAGTDIRFQVATNNDNATWEFKGPGGSGSSYYTDTAGEEIWDGHDGDTYLKYKTWFSDDDSRDSPVLSEASVVYSVAGYGSPPNAVTDLAAEPGGAIGMVDLTWTAPGDDGTVGDNGQGAYYTVKYTTYSVSVGTDTWWATATVLEQVWPVLPHGAAERHTLTGLVTGTVYWFAITATDDKYNQSGMDVRAASAGTQANSVPNDSNNTATATPPAAIQETDGSGLVSVTTTVNDIEGSDCKIKVEYSLDSGVSWTDGNPHIDTVYGVTSTYGSPSLDNDAQHKIYGITTSSGANDVTFRWDTKSALNGAGSMDGIHAVGVKLRITPNDGTVDGLKVVSVTDFEVDNLAPALSVITDVSAVPEAGNTHAMVTSSFVEVNPGENRFYLAMNGGLYGSVTMGEGNTAEPVEQATDAGAVLDGADWISKVMCKHVDDFGNTTENEKLNPSNRYVKPYKPSAPMVYNPTMNNVDVMVRKHVDEVPGLQYCIYESSKTQKYVQVGSTLSANAAWQTITGWGPEGRITVNGLDVPVDDYYFMTKSRNSSDNQIQSEYSMSVKVIISGQDTWIQTTNTDFSAGVTSNVVVSGTGESAYIELGSGGGRMFEVTLSNANGGGWEYRKEITVNNTGSQLTDYQVHITSAGINFEGHAQGDLDDVRFTDSGDTELSHWIGAKGGVDGFWVKVPVINNGNTTLYVYYGNTNATGVSNIKTTFLFGDDFNDGTLDTGQWTWVRESAGDWNEGTSRTDWLMMRTLKDKDLYQTDNDAPVLRSQTNVGAQDVEMMVRIDLNCTVAYQQAALFMYSDDDNFVRCGKLYHTSDYEVAEVGKELSAVWSRIRISETTNDVLCRLVRQGTTYNGYYSTNNGVNWTHVTEYTGISLANSYPALAAFAGGVEISTEIDAYFDNIWVRKYTSSEPSVTDVGGEETGGTVYALTGAFTSNTTNLIVISWDYISWTGDTSGAGMEIKLRIATGDAPDPVDFRGPDGQTTSYYTNPSGEEIWSGHGIDGYIRYKAWLSDDDGDETPELEDVTVMYTVTDNNMQPSAISDLAASPGAGTDEIELTWTAPGNDGTEGDNDEGAFYTVKYATYDVSVGTGTWWNSTQAYIQSWQVLPQGTGEVNVVDGLDSGVTYWFAMRTTDSDYNESGMDTGFLDSGTQASAVTMELPDAPTGASLDNITETSMRLNWTDNSHNEDGFRIGRSTYGTNYNLMGVTGVNASSYTAAGMTMLEVNTEYWYRVEAFRAGDGSGYAYAPSTYTLSEVPGAPQVTAGYDTEMGYNCGVLINAGNNPSWTGYAVSPDGGGAWLQPDGSAGGAVYFSTSAVRYHEGLDADTAYAYRVKAANGSGVETELCAGSGSDVTPLAAPVGLVMGVVTETAASVWWQEPSGSPTGYTVSYGTDALALNIGMVNVSTNSCDWTELSPDTSYYWKVCAANENGSGAYSGIEGFYTKFMGIPEAPTGIYVYVDQGIFNNLHLNWIDNSTSEDGFSIEMSIDNITYNEKNTIGPDIEKYENQTGVIGLNTNSRYWYRIRAYNFIGYSVYSDTVSVWTQAQTPLEPIVAGDYDDTDMWHMDIFIEKRIANDKPNPDYTDYAVFCGTQSLQGNGTLSGTTYWSTECNLVHSGISGLVPSTLYDYTVVARNEDDIETGTSPAGEDTTPPGPGVPFGIILVSSSGSITADGSSTCLLTATVEDVQGARIEDSAATVTFRIAASSCPARLLPEGTTSYVTVCSSGVATASLASLTVTGVVTVIAESAGLEIGVVTLDVAAGEAFSVSLQSNHDFVLVNDSVRLTAAVLDAKGNPVTSAAGTVNFHVYCGNLPRGEYESGMEGDGTSKLEYEDSKSGIMTFIAYYDVIESNSVKVSIKVSQSSGVEILCDKDDGKTRVYSPRGSFSDNAEIIIDLVDDGEAESHEVSGNEEFHYIPGSARQFSAFDLEGGQVTFNSLLVFLPYEDEDGDGWVNDPEVSIDSLRVFHLEDGEWRQEKNWPLVRGYMLEGFGDAGPKLEDEKIARFEVSHFSSYCLMAVQREMEITSMLNYPNPFSNGTTFCFILSSKPEEVSVRIYTISGRLIEELAVTGAKLGYNEVNWEGNLLANGVYFYKITAEKSGRTVDKAGKLTIIR